VVGGFFPIDGFGKLGRAVILAVFIDKGKPLFESCGVPLIRSKFAALTPTEPRR
jgi:hypothetical protein